MTNNEVVQFFAVMIGAGMFFGIVFSLLFDWPGWN